MAGVEIAGVKMAGKMARVEISGVKMSGKLAGVKMAGVKLELNCVPDGSGASGGVKKLSSTSKLH